MEPSIFRNGAGRKLDPEELTAARPSDDVLRSEARLPVAAVLENIRSLWNVGSMFRTADATRLDSLHLCGYTPHPPRPEIDKTALGATEFVPWRYWTKAPDACHWLRAHGFRVLALELTTRSAPLDTIPIDRPLAFVVGNEVTGISDETLSHCDGAIDLPMAGRKESLNVAVAFGVCAYGLRQRVLNESNAAAR